jgi:ribosome-associated toxin RatA of RatAB toxin-antitoxin module
MPYSALRFFNVVKDVDSYSEFLNWMLSSAVLQQTKDEVQTGKTIQGSFDAETQIGFNFVSFTYLSKVSYSRPTNLKSPDTWQITSVSPTSTIFKNLVS